MRFVVALLATLSLQAVDREHVAYLMQSQEINASINLYEELRKEQNHHDFEILQQMAMVILEQGIRSADPEVQLLSLFGASIAGLTSTIDILEEGVKSANPETQMASIQFLARMQDDRCDELLTKAMSSNFLMARMEAGYFLAMRKHRKATGQIEALMYKIPHEFRFYFPQFFALIGTKDAMTVLRQLMEDTNSMVRVEAILNAARYGRDDLLQKIRVHASHLHSDEQEACAAALGILKDSKSIPQLQKLARSPTPHVKLSAARALYLLGDTAQLKTIEEMAAKHNLQAIALLGEFSNSRDTLLTLIKEDNIHVRINAAIALLSLRDPRALPALEEILLRDMRDLGFQPQVSVGHSLVAWKVIPSVRQHMTKDFPIDLYSISLQLREQILVQCLELPEPYFLQIAEKIFDSRQSELVPLLVSLLENHHSEGAIALLKQKAQKAGSPHTRAYCNLALYRLQEKGPYEESVRKWIAHVQSNQMIRFRPTIPFNARKSDATPYELTPEEGSRLLIEAYQALSDRHDEASIEMLLTAIKEGNPKNRYTLAGLLIRAIQ